MADGHGIFTFKNKRHMPGWQAWLIAGVMRLYAALLRKRITDPHGILKRTKRDRPQIYVTWHNRALLAAALLPRHFTERLSVIVSASRDGGYMASVFGRFGIHCVRGSSSHGGVNALMGSLTALKEGFSPTIAVDGPRGPKYTVHPGAAAMAKEGYEVVPFSFNARHYWAFRSWDRMQLPWPLTKVEIVLGDPIAVAPDEEIAAANERIRQGIMAITKDRADWAEEK